ncbi:hypothetical protein BU23DRAFT_558676 [Bimuria novae-zelandiae CBS 107.79]|uniref:Uncharacterized protein n=1 Tax=Bimuria novae-zelandiae CBS 107.79 TaxID=1447943 RepID=A0A6A5UU82_9PLEO|nr:hypothetical protein BU23DRAFT_558676 [Bimuria novae-zelandiae CBS 107.79]
MSVVLYLPETHPFLSFSLMVSVVSWTKLLSSTLILSSSSTTLGSWILLASRTLAVTTARPLSSSSAF